METEAVHAGSTRVREGFDRAARRYDLLTGFNPGYHRHLAAAAAVLAARLGETPPRVLDLGCGSGSSSAALVAALPDAEIVGVDASAQMLTQARAKSWPPRVRFVHSDALELPALGLPPASGILAAYLARNIPEQARDRLLGVLYDQLEPGGWLVVQEYSVAGRRLARVRWTAVCWAVVIPLAWLVRGNPSLYRYLWRSVLAFDSVETFSARLTGAGFTQVERRDVPGWQRGILHTFLACRPPED